MEREKDREYAKRGFEKVEDCEEVVIVGDVHWNDAGCISRHEISQIGFIEAVTALSMTKAPTLEALSRASGGRSAKNIYSKWREPLGVVYLGLLLECRD